MDCDTNEITKAHVWWDNEPEVRLWTLVCMDEDDNQIGDAEWAAQKAVLIESIREHEFHHGPLRDVIVETKAGGRATLKMV